LEKLAVSSENIESMLQLHNAERQSVTPVAAVADLMWDASLAAVAQSYANACVYTNNANRGAMYGVTGATVGENVHSLTTTVGVRVLL
jgi:uncharacterized protein YkwD